MFIEESLPHVQNQITASQVIFCKLNVNIYCYLDHPLGDIVELYTK